METHNENISMSYDERRRELTRLVTTKKEDETTEWKIVLKENGIKKIWDTLIKDKKSAKEARARTEKEISTYDDQLSELEEVELTDEHKKIKETLKILQKDADRANIESKLEDSKKNIEYLDKQIKEKNKLLNELKSKAKNIGLKE